METICQIPVIFNYEEAKAKPYKDYIDSIKNFRSVIAELLGKRGVKLSGAHMIMQEVKRITIRENDYYYFSLVPKDIDMGSRKIGFLVKENGLIKFRLYKNCKAPTGLNPEWRELGNAELGEFYPELQQSNGVWMKNESLEKVLDHIAEFIKERQRN